MAILIFTRQFWLRLAGGLRNGNHLIGGSEQMAGRRRKWPAKQKAKVENFPEPVQGYLSCLPPHATPTRFLWNRWSRNAPQIFVTSRLFRF